MSTTNTEDNMRRGSGGYVTSDLREAIGQECPLSKRPDGKHTWRFSGDDPYIYCHFCGEMRDALTGEALGGSDE